MIHLTRLNGNPLVVNSELIKYAESSPDTMLTLVNGEKIVVLESCEEVVNRTIAYRARVCAEAAPYPQSSPRPTPEMTSALSDPGSAPIPPQED
jgi:flagellar protein FlbD